MRETTMRFPQDSSHRLGQLAMGTEDTDRLGTSAVQAMVDVQRKGHEPGVARRGNGKRSMMGETGQGGCARGIKYQDYKGVI